MFKTKYVDGLSREIGDYVRLCKNQHYCWVKVDVHVFVDGDFVLGIECKSYTENAMLKRILVDFRMLKSLHPHLVCCLLQMESMLGGQYFEPLASPQMGSPSSHTLMSYFPDLHLHIITLLEGERRVKEPIHRPEFFKELSRESLDHAIGRLAGLLKPFV